MVGSPDLIREMGGEKLHTDPIRSTLEKVEDYSLWAKPSR